jgi:FMN-dependent NADH-azoreductase
MSTNSKKTLLQINTSLFAGKGESSQLNERFVASWLAQNPEGRVIKRDLAEGVPHLTAARFGAFITPAADRNAEQNEVIAYSDSLIEELKGADVIVLGLPMYNFSVPSQLKSYFDHIARAGVTFKYTENGPVGLITGKKAYVFATFGSNAAGTVFDTETQYVRNFLGFIGISDVEFVHAQGLSMGPAAKTAGIAQAHSAIDRLAA